MYNKSMSTSTSMVFVQYMLLSKKKLYAREKRENENLCNYIYEIKKLTC